MNMKQTIERWLARRGYLKIPGASGSGGGYAGFFGWSNVGSREEQLKAYQNHVYKCVSVIYRRVMSVPWKLYVERGDEDEEVERHPLIDLLWAPNPYMSGMFMKAVTQMHLDLTGQAFWLKVRNSLGRPAELWPLSPALFSQFVLSEGRTDLVAYEFKTETGGIVRYAPEEIVYFHYPHPIHWLVGASPIQAMAYSYDIDLASRTYQRNFFQNSARPDIVFESDQQISPEDARRLLLAWKGSHQGVSKAWEPAILDNGLKANILSANARDMEFVSLANWTKEDILEAYGVPPAKLGTVVDVNRANGVAVDITFNSECIKPKLMLWDETVSRFLASDYDPKLYVQHDECVPRDEEFDLKAREANLRMKVTTINEERERLGLDEVEWGNAPWISIAEIQYGEEPGIRTESGNRRIGETGKAEEGPEANPVNPVNPVKILKDRADRLRLSHERRVAARSRAYRGYLRKFFKAQETEVLANLKANFRRIEGVLSGMSIPKTRKWLDEHKDQVDQVNFRLDEANKNLIDGSLPYYQAALIAGGEQALAQVGALDVLFDLVNPRVMQFMADKRMLIRDINRVTHDAINETLRAGLEAGETMQQLADRVQSVFGNADEVRSLRIAQTETNSAANAGTLEGYEQSGVVEKKMWVAGPGARPTHQAAAAKYDAQGAIPIKENFHVGAGWGPSPGNIGRPEEDINCRCTIVPIVTARASADPGSRTLDHAPATVDPGPWTQDPGPKTMNVNITLPDMRPLFNVEAPQVHVAPAQVHAAAPVVNVHPADVSVQPPDVHVSVDARPQGKRTVLFKRDKNGELISADVSEE
jgi:HK97 family phage portal protein